MKTCTKCGTTKPPEEFYATGSWCKACKRTAAAVRSRLDYAVNGDARRAYQRDYSRRAYAALSPEQRRARNAESWRRWGRRRYLRQIAAENARRYPPETDPDRLRIRDLSAAQDAEAAQILGKQAR
jgi:hypothetical protein